MMIFPRVLVLSLSVFHKVIRKVVNSCLASFLLDNSDFLSMEGSQSYINIIVINVIC